MDNNLNKSLIKATGEILQSVIGAEVSCKLPVERHIKDTDSETSVIVTFVGSISGAVTLKCSTKFASMIAGEMLGVPVDEGSDELLPLLHATLGSHTGKVL